MCVLLTSVKIQNCLSIYDEEVKLSPFTLMIGANGVGKSNFLQLMDSFVAGKEVLKPHFNHNQKNAISEITLFSDDGRYPEGGWQLTKKRASPSLLFGNGSVNEYTAGVYNLVASLAGKAEQLVPNPTIKSDGSGVVQVLDFLKTGDREDLFDLIEKRLGSYIPEIEKISFIPGQQKKQLQVREKHIQQPVPVSQLSEGTKLVLMILTILHQPNPPSLICIEDIDYGLHPRLFQQLIELCFDIAHGENGTQIIATTHNPYIVDLFKDHEDAVVMVEKKDGYTHFSTLAERMEQLGDLGEDDENPLGELWFSGVLNTRSE